jgi:DNA polymerase IV
MSSSPLTLAAFPRALVHVDADCCFASIEQANNPQCRGKPLITGKERGSVASMSLEAKAVGIRSL